MTEPHTLTDRYVAATLRSIPPHQRTDIDAELRTLIADGIDDRLEAGAVADAAEREVLAGLGDPRRLAAGYADRSLALIGPAYYLDYLRILTALVSTISPVWFIVIGITTFADTAEPFTSFGAALWAAVEVAMTVAFLVTLVFAIIERTSSRRASTNATWDPAALPDIPNRRRFLIGLVLGVAMTVVVAAAVVMLQTFVVAERGDKPPIGPIDAGLWASGLLYVALFFAIVYLAIDVITHYSGWGYPQAVTAVVLNLLFAVPAIWITSTGRLLNPDYFTLVDWPEGVGVITTTLVVVIIVLAVLDVFDAFTRAAKGRTAA